jgi:type I restriction enzyme S subunit
MDAPADGSALKMQRHQLARPGQVILSEIWGKKGAIGLVPAAGDGALCTSHFFLFDIRSDRVQAPYLQAIFTANYLQDQLDARAKGTTGYAAVRPAYLLAAAIPLPPLGEQRRIVARVDALAARIDEARGLRRQAEEETEVLLGSTLHKVFLGSEPGWRTIELGDAVTITDPQVDPTLSEYADLPHISGENIQSKTCRLLAYRTANTDGVRSGNYLFSAGTVLYSKIRPYLQKATFVSFRGVCSADIYPVRVSSTNLEPRFLMWSFVAPSFTSYANRLSGRTRMPKLNRKQLLSYRLSYPDLTEQRRIVAYLDGLQAKVDALRQLQAQTSAELDALLPSILERAFSGEL